MTTIQNNVQLFEKKFAILQEISNALVVTDNIGAIANLMLDLAINYTKAEKGSLLLLNERDELYILAARGIDLHLIQTYRAKIGEGIAGVVAKNRTAVLVEDIERDPRFGGKFRDRYKTRSFISCPIISKSRLLGVLNINDKQDDNPFVEDEFVLIKIIANQAAIALENAMLVNQLRFKAAELEGINRKLIESDIVKTEFITRVSHELRTPLNSIKGSIYYLQQSGKLSGREQQEFHEIISHETDKLITIVENQLDFLRYEDETMIISKTVISLKEIVHEVLDSKLIKTLFARKNISASVQVGDALSDVVGDRVRVAQFFMHILEGLCHFLDPGNTIGIEIGENGHVDVQITLSTRLPENILPYLFSSDHLFQTDQPEEKLKLYLARKVVDLHRWDLTAENRGENFTLSLSIPKSAKQKVDAVIGTTAELFLDFISELLELNICSIMLCDEMSGDLVIKSAKGLDDFMIKQTRIRPGDRIAGWVAQEGKPLYIEDIESDPRFGRKSISQYNAKSLISLPLKVNGKVVGVLNLNNKRSAAPFTTQDFELASLLSERVSFLIERLHSGEHREDEFKQFMTSFDNLINAEKKYHKKDPLLPELALKIMDRLGADEEEKKLALYASLTYDLGLMLLEDNILKKKEKLLPSEEHILKIHPYTTVGLLNNFEFSEDVKEAILHHHESYDGTGYPDGLKGEEIPLIARVLCVVDAFCAMISERPYRQKMTQDEALGEIRKNAGSVYDPRVVKALEDALSSPCKSEEYGNPNTGRNGKTHNSSPTITLQGFSTSTH